MDDKDIIVAVITGIFSVIAAVLAVRKSVQAKELEMAKTIQMLHDQIDFLLKNQNQIATVIDKINNIENKVISIEKDVDYLKKGYIKK